MKNIILLISFTLAIISSATAAPTVSLVPSSMNLKVGDTFNVNVSVDPGSIEILGAQFDLNYTSSKINAVGIEKGTFLTQDGLPSMIAVRSCWINMGQCNYGETRVGVTNGIITPGTLAIITFKAQDAGEVSLQIDNIFLSDQNASIIPNVIYYNAVVKIQSSDAGGNTDGIDYGNGGGISSENNSNIETEIPIEIPNEKVGGFDVVLAMIIITMIYILSRR